MNHDKQVVNVLQWLQTTGKWLLLYDAQTTGVTKCVVVNLFINILLLEKIPHQCPMNE